MLSNRAVNELLTGYASYLFGESNLTHWSNHWMAKGGPFGAITTGSPRITLTGFTIGGNNAAPRYRVQNLYSVKDNFTLSYDAKGAHDLKTGGEFLLEQIYTANCTQCMGVIDARGGPLPANMEQIFPDPFNVDTWNLAAISRITRRYTLGVHKSRREPERVWAYSAFAQDDWHPNEKLTLNLGLRYDLMWDMFQNQQQFLPIMEAGRPQNTRNLQPRVGFAYQWNSMTVIRGGVGKLPTARCCRGRIPASQRPWRWSRSPTTGGPTSRPIRSTVRRRPSSRRRRRRVPRPSRRRISPHGRRATTPAPRRACSWRAAR